MQQRHLQTEETALSTETAGSLPLLQDLAGEEGNDRQTAETLFSTEQEEAAEVLGTALSLETQQFRRSILRGIGGITVFSALMIAVKLALGNEAWEALFPAHLFISGSLSLLLLFSLFIVNSGRRPRQRRRALTAKVADQYDVRSIGSLIDALYLHDGKTREISIAALTILLPRLKSDDAALLNEAQRARLCSLLNVPVENPLHKDVRTLFRPADHHVIAFRVAILQAFAQVGDRKALPLVERLAKSEAKTEGEKRIQEAAQTCLPMLQQRTSDEDHSRTLLRASNADAKEENVLLRPAEERQDWEPQTLLRPGQRDI